MAETPEQRARTEIDRLLVAASRLVQDYRHARINAVRGVGIHEFQLRPGFGKLDYLCYVDARAAGIIEAKKEGTTLICVEVQFGKYTDGLSNSLPA